MTEGGYRQVEAEETRRLLGSFGYWDLVVLGALLGAGLGFSVGLAEALGKRAGRFLPFR